MDRYRAVGRWLAVFTTVALLAGCSTGAGGSPASSAAPATTTAATSAPGTAATVPSAAVVPTPTAAPIPALALLWEKSGPTQPTPCCQTWWPAIDPKTGDIWVANSFASQYWIFAPDGTFKEAWGTPGSGPGQFDFSAHRSDPQAIGAIAFAPDGSFFVADAGNVRIEKFDAKRHLITTWGTFGSSDGQFSNPFGIVTDGKTVYVADDDRGDVQAFDANGKFLRAFGPIENDAGIFIAIDSKGTLYRAGGEAAPSSVLKYAADGTVAATLDSGEANGFVTGIAADVKGNLFVGIGHAYAAGHELVELSPTGHAVGLWSTGGETDVIDPSGSAIYEASNGDSTWPTASLRKYALSVP